MGRQPMGVGDRVLDMLTIMDLFSGMRLEIAL